MILAALILAEQSIAWSPALATRGALALAIACVLVWFTIRLFWGRSLVSGRTGLLLLRGLSIATLVAILFGPTLVDEQQGETRRPAMLLLFDGSQSMQLGGPTNRWESALRFAKDAQLNAGPEHDSSVQAFRFGHRLEPLEKETRDQDESSTSVNTIALKTEAAASIDQPDATDSRLADALRQLLPQVDAESSAGVVLLSDGRVRASESVERMTEIFAQAKVPIHVVPVGNTDGSGDIAIVSLVIPSRVRKYTENELQVFLRSFGYAGKQTTVRVRRRGIALDDPSGEVASLPITLTGGAQSASLTFRVDEHAEDFVVIVDPLSEELSKRNNQVETRVEIDRTKVRVLYVTADRPSTSSSFLGSLFSVTPATSDLAVGDVSVQSALQADEDVECTTLISVGGSTLRRVADRNGGLSSEGFPNTRAELFAFDCVIFCDVSPDILEDEQQQWLTQWIDGRGGGLILCGAPALGSNGLSDSPLRSLLPFSTDPAKISRTAIPSAMTVNDASHPIWRLKIEQRLNAQLIDQLPQLAVSTTQLAAKPNATVLLQNQDDASPIMLSQRAGRGRTLVTSASLSGAALKQLSQSWGPQPERVAGKFWRNMVYWATEASSTGRRRLVATSSQRFYRPGQSVGVRAVAYDEAARRTNRYRIWAMLEPESLDDMSLYSPVLWPENVIRDSGEVGPRIAWGEELPLKPAADDDDYSLELMLSETTSGGDSGVRIELTAYEGSETGSSFNHGTQIDSTSLGIQILSDPFEQQNPLPNHELLAQVASLSGGTVLRDPSELSDLLRQRPQTEGPPTVNSQPAWSHWWLWMMLVGSLTTEWIWRRMTGLA